MTKLKHQIAVVLGVLATTLALSILPAGATGSQVRVVGYNYSTATYANVATVTETGVSSGDTLLVAAESTAGGTGGDPVSSISGGNAHWSRVVTAVQSNLDLEWWQGTGTNGGNITVTVTWTHYAGSPTLFDLRGVSSVTPEEVTQGDSSLSCSSPMTVATSGSVALVAQISGYRPVAVPSSPWQVVYRGSLPQTPGSIFQPTSVDVGSACWTLSDNFNWITEGIVVAP